MRADLEAAARHPAEARIGKVIQLWKGADAELAPLVNDLKRRQAELP